MDKRNVPIHNSPLLSLMVLIVVMTIVSAGPNLNFRCFCNMGPCKTIRRLDRCACAVVYCPRRKRDVSLLTSPLEQLKHEIKVRSFLKRMFMEKTAESENRLQRILNQTGGIYKPRQNNAVKPYVQENM